MPDPALGKGSTIPLTANTCLHEILSLSFSLSLIPIPCLRILSLKLMLLRKREQQARDGQKMLFWYYFLRLPNIFFPRHVECS